MVVRNSKTHDRHEKFDSLVANLERTTPDINDSKGYVESLHGCFRGAGLPAETTEEAGKAATPTLAGYRDRVFSMIGNRN